MTIAVLAIVSLALTWGARLLFGSWFNHASHYALVWGISLILFEIRLIDYYPLEPEAWMMIGSAWLAFTTGSVLPLIHGPGAAREGGPGSAGDVPDARALKYTILLLSVAALVAVVQHWAILVAKFGSVFNVIVLGNIVYSLRLSEGFEMGIPYLDSLALPATLLGGVYTAVQRRFSLVATLPMLVVIAEAIGMMGRMKIIIAVILFLCGYFVVSWRRASGARGGARSLFRRWAVVGFALLLFAGAGEIVRSKRGIEEVVAGSRQSLRALQSASFITPSIYMYLSVHHGVFNQYLKRDEEHHILGGNTFAPVYRLLSSFGMETRIPQYEKFYSTPVTANTGSYLREIHGDFGVTGIFVLPFLLGFLASLFWLKFRDGGGLVHLTLFAHSIVVVDLSTMLMGTRFGYWLVSLLSSLAVCWYIDRRTRRGRA